MTAGADGQDAGVQVEERTLTGGWRTGLRFLLRIAVLAAFVSAVAVIWSILTGVGLIGDREQLQESRFEDVPVDSPFYDAVDEVSRLGILSGTTRELFAPDESLTRGQFATVVVKAMEWPVSPDEKEPFADVEGRPTLDTADYIAVLYQRKVMTGRPGEEPTFAPEDNVSLEQAIIALVRAAGDELDQPITPEQSIEERPYSQPLKDALQVSQRNGLLSGTGIDPESSDFGAPAQRQQVAALVYNLRRALRL